MFSIHIFVIVLNTLKLLCYVWKPTVSHRTKQINCTVIYSFPIDVHVVNIEFHFLFNH
jgi:hypothetical protein